MQRATSFSQNSMFEKSPCCWFLKYVKKIPTYDDMSYAEAGKVIHGCLEKFYNKEIDSTEKLKEHFAERWGKARITLPRVKMAKDKYWLMVLNGMELNLPITSTELKIYFPDVVGYIDHVNTNDHELGDWKSSTRSKENEEDYTKQLKFYCYLYFRKFNHLPTKATVYYLKYTGTKGKLEFKPTMDDIVEMEKWNNDTREKMAAIRLSGIKPTDPCNFGWCPYDDLCNHGGQAGNGLEFTLNIIGNNILINGPISELLHRGLQKKFSYEFKNAYFMKKANPYARTTMEFWNPRNRLLPIGFLKGVEKTLHDYAEHKKIPLQIDIQDKREFDKIKIKMPEHFINGVELRNYQTDAVDKFLKNQIAVLEIGTGGGKTEIAIECIRRLGQKTLFIVDKIELLRQTKTRIENALGITVGQIGAGVNDIQPITVATIQTLMKSTDTYSKYLQTVHFVIFDETHKVAARSYLKIAAHLTGTKYRLGISGTAYRDDGNDMMITAVTGPKVYDLSSDKLVKLGWLVKPTIIFIKDFMEKDQVKELDDSLKQGLINETPDYNNFYDGFITKNVMRNIAIQNMVNNNKDKKILILTKRIEHGEILNQMLEGSLHLYGATNKDERAEMFEKFVNGNSNVLISTISIFAEGIDIPSLDMVINASANKGNVKTIQVLGRVLRKMEGKKDAQYIDFLDDSRFFRVASLARRKSLISEGHEVDTKKADEL